MKRKRTEEEYSFEEEEKPLKKIKLDNLSSSSDFQQIETTLQSPDRAVTSMVQEHSPRSHAINSFQSQMNPPLPPQLPIRAESLHIPPQPTLPMPSRRSVLEERENPHRLRFKKFNEERRKSKLSPLTRMKFNFLEEHRCQEIWQYTLDEIREEILSFFSRNDGSFTGKEIFEGIREVPHVRSHWEGRSEEQQKEFVRSCLNTISKDGFLEKKTKPTKRKDGRKFQFSYSLRYFTGVQDYQIFPLISKSYAILYSLTFTNRVMSRNDIMVDINTRIFNKKEFRMEGGGGITYFQNLRKLLKQLSNEGIIKSEKHKINQKNNKPSIFYFLSSRPNLDRSFVPPPKPNEEERKRIILKILQGSGKEMTNKEIYESSNELSRWSVKRINEDLKKLFDDGILSRKRRGKGQAPFEYSLKEEPSSSDEEDADNSLSIPPPPPTTTVIIRPKTYIKREIDLEEDFILDEDDDNFDESINAPPPQTAPVKDEDEEEESPLFEDTENSISIPPPLPPPVSRSTKMRIKREDDLEESSDEEEEDYDEPIGAPSPPPPSRRIKLRPKLRSIKNEGQKIVEASMETPTTKRGKKTRARITRVIRKRKKRGDGER